MKLNQLSLLAVLAGSQFAVSDEEVHGQGAEGTVMGPVAFLWPADRPWSASADNVAPCGSTSGPSNRTIFPLSQGSVALSIADDAWNVVFSIAFDDDPTTQSQFTEQAVSNISSIEPGHQCYKIAEIPDSVAAGSNATIQLEYWSSVDDELNGQNQSFYACADITFVEASNFDIQVPCFNVTSADFNSPDPSTSTALPSATATSDGAAADTNSSSSNNGGLSASQTAGIAVGVVVASLLVVGTVAWTVLRRRKSRVADQEGATNTAKVMSETASAH
ncbi:hypothetical protein F5X96DRAFT_658239 [Biscogniauxia mediterranea]|nr:hypothetical protein F5X96DRAFT_658239 [Biscogniauxia mediterranea]